MNKALLVFCKDVDSFTLSQQIKHITESQNIFFDDVYCVDKEETYENLKEELEKLPNYYDSLIYLTEDSEWVNFEYDMKQEFGNLFEITVLPKLAERLYEANPTQVVSQKPQQAQPKAEVSQTGKGWIGAIFWPMNAPFKDSLKIAQDVAKAVDQRALLFIPSLIQGQFLSQSTILTLIRAYLGSKTNLKTNTENIFNISSSNPNLKTLYAETGLRSLEHMKPQNVWIGSDNQTLLKNIQATIYKKPIQPHWQTNANGQNSAAYSLCVEIHSDVSKQKETNHKQNEDNLKAAKKLSQKTAAHEKEMARIDKQYRNKQMESSYKGLFDRLIEETETTETKKETKKEDQLDTTDYMIWEIVKGASDYKEGKVSIEEDTQTLRKNSNEKLATFLKILGADKDAAAAEQLARFGGYGLVIDTAKAIKSLASKSNKEKQEQIERLDEDEVRLMTKHPKYKQLKAMFDDLGPVNT